MKDDSSVETRSRRAFCTPLASILVAFFLWVMDYYGAAYPSGTDPLIQQQQLSASDKTVGVEEQFGSGVAISGDTAVVGAPGSDAAGSSSGAAYVVFTRNAEGHWTQGQKLTPSDGARGDLFGNSAALNNDTTLIGARGDSSQGNFAGAVYVFVRDTNGQWNQGQKLTASDGAAGDELGYSVAANDEAVLVGARFAEGVESPTGTVPAGAVYVFALGAGPIGTVWDEGQKLVASDGAARDEFGSSVALSGDTALVGAHSNNSAGAAAGAMYLFSLTQDTQGNSQWTQTQKLTARDGAAGDEFGSKPDFMRLAH